MILTRLTRAKLAQLAKLAARRAATLAASALIAAGIIGCQPQSPPAAMNGSGATGDVARNTQLARDETERAYQLIRDGKFTDAEPILRRALLADAMYGPARNNLGLVYYHLDQLYKAAWEFENAIKLMPRQAEPNNNLGLVLEKAAKLSEAMRSYTRATELEPDHAEYAGNLARVRIRLGLRDEQTRRLLDVVMMRDTRPEWVEWARSNLTRLRQAAPENPAPAPSPSPQPRE